MKKLILPFLILLLANAGYTQTGAISVVSIPDQIEAGATVDLQFTYTSDVPADFVVQLFQTQENSLAVDYTTWQAAVTVADQPAGTNLPITVSFTVPASISPSSSLTNRQYTFDAKLTSVTGGTDFGWSNGTAAHTVEIVPSSVVVDNIDFTAATPASVDPGDNLSVSFEYTLSEPRNVKAGLAIYTTDGAYVGNATVEGTEVAQYFSDQPATTTTPVQQTASIAIPATLTPSSQLPAGQQYMVVVSIYTTTWEYLTDKKNVITVNEPTGVNTTSVEARLNVFPNPASDAVHVSYPGEIQSITLYTASGSEIIIDPVLTDNGFNINTSGLKKGIYILNVSTGEGTGSVKLMK